MNPSEDNTLPLTVEQHADRLFGYQLGDVVQEQVIIHTRTGLTLDPQSLPHVGKRAGWFAVHSVALQDTPVAQGHDYTLHLEFQLINSTHETRRLTIPPVLLRFTGEGGRVVEQGVGDITIDATPLGTGELRSGMDNVAPARPAVAISTEPQQHLLAVEAVSALGLLLWLVTVLVLRRLRPRRACPFALAYKELRRQKYTSHNTEALAAAVRRLHRAFDEGAGQRVFLEGLPALCAAWRAPDELRLRSEEFFKVSRVLFFDSNSAPAELLFSELIVLARDWARLERKRT
jgi:mxaA protein